jgi:hypothetical protein
VASIGRIGAWSTTGRSMVWQLPHMRELLMYSSCFGFTPRALSIGSVAISSSLNGPKISSALPVWNWPVIVLVRKNSSGVFFHVGGITSRRMWWHDAQLMPSRASAPYCAPGALPVRRM